MRIRGASAFHATFDRQPKTLFRDALCGPTINPYPLCEFRCSYCLPGVQGPSEPLFAKDVILDHLERESESIPLDRRLSLGGISDAYPWVEADFGVSRMILSRIIDMGFRVGIVTKGTTLLRDRDLLTKAYDINVTISVGHVSNEIAKSMEPFAPLATDRIAMANQLASEGVEVNVCATPWIPTISDIQSLTDSLDPKIAVAVGCLNITHARHVPRRVSQAMTQVELNQAFIEAIEEVGTPPNVGWLGPSGSPISAGPVFRKVFRDGIQRKASVKLPKVREKVIVGPSIRNAPKASVNAQRT